MGREMGRGAEGVGGGRDGEGKGMEKEERRKSHGESPEVVSGQTDSLQ